MFVNRDGGENAQEQMKDVLVAKHFSKEWKRRGVTKTVFVLVRKKRSLCNIMRPKSSQVQNTAVSVRTGCKGFVLLSR